MTLGAIVLGVVGRYREGSIEELVEATISFLRVFYPRIKQAQSHGQGCKRCPAIS